MGDALLKIIKFLLGILLLPLSVASIFSFREHISGYPEDYKLFLMWGAGAFLLIFLFFYQFFRIHEFGQKMTSGMFRLVSPFNVVLANCIPIYTFIILAMFFGVGKIFNTSAYNHYFLFFAGFTLAMHILLVAQDLQINEQNLAKPHYLFVISFVVVASLSLTVLLLDLTSGSFTFPKFFTMLISHAKDYYYLAYKKIILFH